jgi:hypothetical protein
MLSDAEKKRIALLDEIENSLPDKSKLDELRAELKNIAALRGTAKGRGRKADDFCGVFRKETGHRARQFAQGPIRTRRGAPSLDSATINASDKF